MGPMADWRRRTADLERFRSLVAFSANPDACHEWTGRRNFVNGYGSFSADGRQWGAHRWILGVSLGRPLARSEEARHACDNPPCVNLKHLLVGTHADNMADMAARGRGRGWNADKSHCPQGHPYAGDNLTVRSDGARGCRACGRASDERRRRAAGIAVKRRPFCPQGHEFTPENTRIKASGSRTCRQCGRDEARRRRARPPRPLEPAAVASGQVIRSRRAELGLSLREAARRAGIDHMTWAAVETGKSVPSDRTRAGMAAVLAP